MNTPFKNYIIEIMKLPLAYYGNPVLRQKGARVDEINDELRLLVQDMVETMFAERGMGLAAPQVSRSIALFITHVPIEKGEDEWEEGPLRVFINPKIIERSDEEWILDEGCLSIPGVRGDVIRPITITIEYTDMMGERKTETYTGLEARCIMHENDHINGTLYIDRMDPKERKAIENHLRGIKKKYNKS